MVFLFLFFNGCYLTWTCFTLFKTFMLNLVQKISCFCLLDGYKWHTGLLQIISIIETHRNTIVGERKLSYWVVIYLYSITLVHTSKVLFFIDSILYEKYPQKKYTTLHGVHGSYWWDCFLLYTSYRNQRGDKNKPIFKKG